MDQVTACQELTKIQRVVCLAVTDTMRSAPTMALEAVLYLESIDVLVKKAILTAYRLLDQPGHKPEDLTGQLKILDMISEEEEEARSVVFYIRSYITDSFFLCLIH